MGPGTDTDSLEVVVLATLAVGGRGKLVAGGGVAGACGMISKSQREPI
jgi:hypothetical protein